MPQAVSSAGLQAAALVYGGVARSLMGVPVLQ